MKNYIIAPTHDVDSLISHVVGEIWEPGVEHRSLEYKHEDVPFRNIPETGNQHIVLSDFGYSTSESNKKMVEKFG